MTTLDEMRECLRKGVEVKFRKIETKSLLKQFNDIPVIYNGDSLEAIGFYGITTRKKSLLSCDKEAKVIVVHCFNNKVRIYLMKFSELMGLTRKNWRKAFWGDWSFDKHFCYKYRHSNRLVTISAEENFSYSINKHWSEVYQEIRGHFKDNINVCQLYDAITHILSKTRIDNSEYVYIEGNK